MNLPSFSKTPTNDPLTNQIVRPMMWIIISLVFLGFVVALFQSIADRTTSLLLALACLLLGAFAGFLFGIPRVLQTDNPVVPTAPTPPAGSPASSTSPAASPAYTQRVNTNLEQISDWLTKIIVGLGLVNLGKIPDLLGTAAERIANGIKLPHHDEVAVIFANALILYFPVVGFLAGYLATRVFLPSLFKISDTGELFQLGGREVPLTDVVKNLVNVVSNNLATPDSGPVTRSAFEAPIPKRILWVGDNPNNNALERETLTKEGIEVTEAVSTADGLSQLAQGSFDLVISDMGRTENGVYNATAGIDLLKQMQTMGSATIRKIIYCSKQGAIQYGAQARQAGADDVVYSPRILIKSIGITS